MRIRFSCLAGLVWTMLCGFSPVHAADTVAEKRLVVIEPSSGSQLSRSARERLRTSIAEVVARSGITQVPTSSLPDRLLHCDIPGCLPQIAAASGAALVLRVQARFAKESFKLTVDLWNADEGRLLGEAGRDCPICDEQDLWGSAALITQGLIERSLREPPKPTPTVHTAAAVVPRIPMRASPAVELAVPQSEPRTSRRLAGYAGFALAVAGLTTLVVGAYYIGVDGNSACFQCDRVRDTGKYGWPIAIAGGLTLAGGAGLVVWSFRPAHAEVAVGPAGLLLAGRFQ